MRDEQMTLMRRFVVALAGWTAVTTGAVLLLPGSAREAWFVLVVIAALVLPPVIFVVGCRVHAPLRAVVLRLDLSAITAVQGMRIAGIAMLTLWAAGVMAPAFALWAGGLDVVIGLTAVPMAYLVANRRPVPRRVLRAWNALGLLDFVVAVPLGVALTPSALGVLFEGGPSAAAMFTFPLSFIPMVGVPFMIIMHLVGIMQVRDDLIPVSGPLLHSPATVPTRVSP
jgi:hypothetical protein